MISLHNNVSASYSCTSGCGDHFAGASVYVNGSGTGSMWISHTMGVGEPATVSVLQSDTNCFSTTAVYPLPFYTASSDNPSVATLNNSQITAVAEGQTTIRIRSSVTRCDCSQECIFTTAEEEVARINLTVVPFCQNKPLCRACTPAGRACDGNGQCKTGVDLIPQICSQLRLTYANQTTPGCGTGACGAKIQYDVTRVTHSCDSVSLGTARVTETVTTDNGCGPGSVTTGAGCPINNDNTISGCTDVYAICGPATAYPSGGCTEVYTQKLFIGSCNAETRTITFRITKTATSCSGTATRN